MRRQVGLENSQSREEPLCIVVRHTRLAPMLWFEPRVTQNQSLGKRERCFTEVKKVQKSAKVVRV